MEFSGKSYEDKVSDLREYLMTRNMDAMVVSEEDEINWLFNVRGESETVGQVS